MEWGSYRVLGIAIRYPLRHWYRSSLGGRVVSMTDLLQQQEIAMAIGGFMLLLSIAMTTGVTITNATLGTVFKSQLQKTLHGPGEQEVII